jgi:hypothetical protein
MIMSRDDIDRSLHHDLYGALSAVRMSIELLEAMEAGGADAAPERLVVIQRARTALTEAIELAERLAAEGSGPAAGRN